MTQTTSSSDLITFPCAFPIKAIGSHDPDTIALIKAIIHRHVPDNDIGPFTSRLSRTGQWLAMTVVIQAHSQQQLDAIYQELSAHPAIQFAL
jgi:hypothetical protein